MRRRERDSSRGEGGEEHRGLETGNAGEKKNSGTEEEPLVAKKRTDTL